MTASNEINPFTIDISEEAIADLHRRLDNTRWPQPEVVDDWNQGIPLAYAQRIAHHWRNNYDWSEREARLNRFDHYTTELDGIEVAFIHQRSSASDAKALIITHGWPGSIIEFDAVIEPLTEAGFHVVCPSMPGYGFSETPPAPGWGIEKTAELWDELMSRLGYTDYIAQGGDWGSMVTAELGRNTNGCSAIHLNMPLGRPSPDDLESPEAQAALAALTHYSEWDSGYSTQQKSRPQTLGYGLADSPVGQMAWIFEKYWAWTDCTDSPEEALDIDSMLDNVMLYWLTNAGATSARLYWESFGGATIDKAKVEVPTGAAAFPKEILPSPRSWCEASYNIVHWTNMDRGGHFAAWEQPELFVADIVAFSTTLDSLQ